MSDTMLFGVLRMPYKLAMSTELSRLQFHDRAQQACDTIERLTAERDAHAVAIENQRNNALNMLQELTGLRSAVLRVNAERDALRADAERLREFDAWLDDRAGPLLHIDDVRAARTGSKT